VDSGIHAAGRPKHTKTNKAGGPGGADSTRCHREVATSPKHKGSVTDLKYPCWAVHSAPPLCATPAELRELDIAPGRPSGYDQISQPVAAVCLPVATTASAHMLAPMLQSHREPRHSHHRAHMHTPVAALTTSAVPVPDTSMAVDINAIMLAW
jgi:hypothetical protein